VSDISLEYNTSTGFAPNQYDLVIPLASWQRNDTLDFKIEYYDIDNSKAPITSYNYNTVFDGNNFYIDGDDNLLTGSLFVGNNIEAHGFELAGKNSAYLRTRDYSGFTSASEGTSSGILM